MKIDLDNTHLGGVLFFVWLYTIVSKYSL